MIHENICPRNQLASPDKLKYRAAMSEKMNTLQKLAFFCILSLIALVFMGGIVRATGSGMGCPDWPTCWGKLIPPFSSDQIDVYALDIEKYKRKRAQHGGDPNTITYETVLDEFNPVHTWIEFTNRLLSMPISFGSLALLIYAQLKYRKKLLILGLSYASVALVLINAIMGARVVYTGLRPGVITTHMALAILLLCILVFLQWFAGEQKKSFCFAKKIEKYKKTFWLGIALFIMVVFEGVLGSQVREMTDTLQKSHGDAPRSEWILELEGCWVYLTHRSFSWLILGTAIAHFILCKKSKIAGLSWQEYTILGTILAQMILGIILANVGILPIAQILHIGLSSILVATLFYWILCASQFKGKVSSS